MTSLGLDQRLQDLYEAADHEELRRQLSDHLADLGFWCVCEYINAVRISEYLEDIGAYVWDNFRERVGSRRDGLVSALNAGGLPNGVEDENRRLRWAAKQKRPYLTLDGAGGRFAGHHYRCGLAGDFGLRAANTLVVPLPDGGAGRRRIWAFAESVGALRNAREAAALITAYNHMSQLLPAAEHAAGDRHTVNGGTDAARVAATLTHAAMLPHQAGPFAQTGMLRAQTVRAYIENHLNDPELGVDRLCREFAVSRRTIYRMFADDGGVARYLTERRLARAFAELRSASPSRGLIHSVALDCGFNDLPRFSRLFRQRFAIAPSDVVGLGPADDKPAAWDGGSAGRNPPGSPPTDRGSRSGRSDEESA